MRVRSVLVALVFVALLQLHAQSVFGQPDDDEFDPSEYDGEDEQEDEGEATYEEGSPVHIGTEENFDKLLGSLPPIVMVEFYAPWCGHCKELKPAFEEAADTIKDKKVGAALVAVDATKAQHLANKYKVEGFPTIIIFKNGERLQDYQGGREADDIASALELLTLPPVIDVATEDDENKLKGGAVALLSALESPAAQAFAEAATALRNSASASRFRCAALSTDMAKKLGVAAGTVVLRRTFPGEEKAVTVKYEGDMTATDLAKFATSNLYPVVAEITPDSYELFETRGLPFVWMFVSGHGKAASYNEKKPKKNTPEAAAKQKESLDSLRAAAEEYSSQYSFVWVSGDDFADHAQQMGVDPKVLPAVVITPAGSQKKFVMNQTESVNAASIKKFVGQHVNGELKATVRSQPIPESNDQPVKVIVANTIDDLVWNSPNDVFIEFYAPWCGHCRSLEPKYNKLAELVKDVPFLTIAKINAIDNDVSEEIAGFPTLYLSPADSNSDKIEANLSYEGEHTVAGMLKFIKKHAKKAVISDALVHNATGVSTKQKRRAKKPASPPKARKASATKPNTQEDVDIRDIDHDGILKLLKQFQAIAPRLSQIVQEHKDLTEGMDSGLEYDESQESDDEHFDENEPEIDDTESVKQEAAESGSKPHEEL